MHACMQDLGIEVFDAQRMGLRYASKIPESANFSDSLTCVGEIDRTQFYAPKIGVPKYVRLMPSCKNLGFDVFCRGESYPATGSGKGSLNWISHAPRVVETMTAVRTGHIAKKNQTRNDSSRTYCKPMSSVIGLSCSGTETRCRISKAAIDICDSTFGPGQSLRPHIPILEPAVWFEQT